jgi:hypothetical protein
MEPAFPDIGLIVATILFLSFITFWILALIRIIKNDFPGENEKLIWGLIIIFLPLVQSSILPLAGPKK